MLRHLPLLLAALAVPVLAQPTPDAVVAMAGRGDTDGLRAALDAGADPDAYGGAFATIYADEVTPLIEAAGRGHAGAVRLLLEAGATAWQPDGDGRSPLWYAADAGSVEVARLLLEYDAPLEDGSDGTTPLMWAASGDKTAVVAFLLDAGADLHARDGNDNTVLRKAVSPLGATFGNARTVALLLEHGADPAPANVRGYAPLHAALRPSPGALLPTHLLIEAGADPTARTADGHSVLSLAAEQGHPLVQAYLQGDATAKAQADLLAAVLRDDVEGVRAAVAAGANPNGGAASEDEEASQDGTALHFAAYLGHAGLVSILVEAGADVQATDDQGFTPLYRAAEAGDLATIEALLTAGADPDGTREWSFLGMEPIHLAALSGEAAVVQALLDAGANPDWTTSATYGDGYNALGFAVRDGHRAVAQVLLDAGADPNLLGENQRTPLDLARERGWTAVAALLRERGGTTSEDAYGAYVDEQLASGYSADDLFIDAAGSDTAEPVRALLDRGLTPPLDALAAAATPETVRVLIEAGLDPNGRMLSGSTPLLDAIGLVPAEAVGALLDAGADPNVPGPDGRYPLHLAVAYDRLDVVTALLGAGADVNVTSAEGTTPLQLAREYDRTEYVGLLVDAGASD